MNNKFLILLYSSILVACSTDSPQVETTPVEPPKEEPIVQIPIPDPTSRILYNGITLPSVWPPYVSYSTNLYSGMNPFYLKTKPSVIDITIGRQLFVDDFLIKNTTLTRKWYQAKYYENNPVLKPEKEWEMTDDKGGGFAAPFSDGIWYDEVDQKFKMWYMAGGKGIDTGDFVTCYAESTDGIKWIRPELKLVSGTNIINKGSQRDACSVWLDKTTSDTSQRYKMFLVAGGPGNWAYHYYVSSNGTSWRELKKSGSLADRSTAFYNPFRGVWAFSMRHNIRVDANNLLRCRDYHENANPLNGVESAKAELQKFWFGPWPNEPRHPIYNTQQPAIYNLDAIGYESLMIGTFTSWAGPENDVCAKDNVLKLNQLFLGFSRDGWSWYREDFLPFCSVSNDKAEWNNGNLQSVNGCPIIVDDKLYFFLSGRKLNSNNVEIVSTGLATLRRDGFASMSGSGELLTEKIKFTGSNLYVNANISGTLKIEILDENENVINGFTKDDCIAFTGNKTKSLIQWKNNLTLSSLKGKIIKIKFYVQNGDLYSFWISQFENGSSYGYTAGGGKGLSQFGIDL